MAVSEFRVCQVCDRDMTVTLHATLHASSKFHPTLCDVEDSFFILGWRGYFCPSHAHLDARCRRPRSA